MCPRRDLLVKYNNPMSDHVAVTNLLYRYGELMDLGDFEGVADLLADTVVTVEGIPGEQRGRVTILAMYVDWTRRYEDDGTPHTRHLISNPIIEVDEAAGSATIRSCTPCCSRSTTRRCSRSSSAATTTPSSASTASGASPAGTCSPTWSAT